MLDFRSTGRADVEAMAAILALGMCTALRQGLVSPGFACYKLFGPALLSWLRRVQANETLVDAMARATELEDLKRLVPDAYEPALAEIERDVVAVIQAAGLTGYLAKKWVADDRT